MFYIWFKYVALFAVFSALPLETDLYFQPTLTIKLQNFQQTSIHLLFDFLKTLRNCVSLIQLFLRCAYVKTTFYVHKDRFIYLQSAIIEDKLVIVYQIYAPL